nr:immunoglobulin light chain junction region [Macaca mulatta]
CQQHDGYPPTF